MGAVRLPGALTHPRPVGGGQQRAAGFPAQHGQFVVEQQRLMAGPHRHAELRAALGGAAPAQVEHGVAGGPVSGEQMVGVGAAQLGVGLRPVDHVAPVDGQFDAVHGLGRLRAGLAELPGESAHPQHRLPGRELHRPGEHVEQRRLAGDVLRGGLGRVLGAVAGLEDLHMAGRGLAQQGPEAVYGLDVHEGRHAPQMGADPVEPWVIGPVGLLESGQGANVGLNVGHRIPSAGHAGVTPAGGGLGHVRSGTGIRARRQGAGPVTPSSSGLTSGLGGAGTTVEAGVHGRNAMTRSPSQWLVVRHFARTSRNSRFLDD